MFDKHEILQEIGSSFTRQNPSFEISLPLSQQHIYEQKILPEIERRLVDNFFWGEGRAYSAWFVINEIVAHAFEHGCGGSDELKVSMVLKIEKNKLLVIKVTSPSPVFNLQDILHSSPEINEVEREGRLYWVKQCVGADQLVASSDGQTIEATIRRSISLGKDKWGCFDDVRVVKLDTKCVAIINLDSDDDHERLDVHNYLNFKEKFTNWLENGNMVRELNAFIVNLENVRFLDSSGLGTLLYAYKISDKKSILMATVVQPRVKAMFELTGTTRVLNCFDNLDMALKFFEEKLL